MPLLTGSLSDEPRLLNPDGAAGRRLLRSARKLKRAGFDRAAEEVAAKGGLAAAQSGGIASAEEEIAARNAERAIGRFDRLSRLKQALGTSDSASKGPASGGTATPSGSAPSGKPAASPFSRKAGEDVSSRIAAYGRAELARDKADTEGRAILREGYEKAIQKVEREGLLRDLSTVSSPEDITRKNAEIDARRAAAQPRPIAAYGSTPDDILNEIRAARAGIAEVTKPTAYGPPASAMTPEMAGPPASAMTPEMAGPPASARPPEQAGPPATVAGRYNVNFRPAERGRTPEDASTYASELIRKDIEANAARRKRIAEANAVSNKAPMPYGVDASSPAASLIRGFRRFKNEYTP